MGYSFLADVNPIYCLYSSLFPTLIYGLTGTSQYCSVGTFAALSIMTGTVIKETKLAIYRENMLKHSAVVDNSFIANSTTEYSDVTFASNQALGNASVGQLVESLDLYNNEDIAFVCSFVVGFYLLLFGT